MNVKKLAYDSDTVPGDEKLTYRLRLWTDPAGQVPPVIMASERQGWDKQSVVNASEFIYSYFNELDALKSAYSKDKSPIDTIARFALEAIIAKINFKIQSSMGNTGSVHDISSAVEWFGKKTIPELSKLKSAINEYYEHTKQLKNAYRDVIFVEHFIGRKAVGLGEVTDNFNLEKFFITNYKKGSREEVGRIFEYGLMLEHYGVDGI
jgi:hypothetical protein